ncbi:MAG: adenine deaminase [Chloroflexi bacterium]|nr:adenine deaminase [Chloroflexota bacterium]
MKMGIERLISVARGESPADLVLTDARIVNTFNGEIEEGNVAICGGSIAGVGDYKQGRQVIDLKGKYLSPSLTNGHIHTESSMLHVSQYARAVVPRGTLAVVTDFHEIANVSGIRGIKYMMGCAQHLPLDLYLMVPSCVPATHLETSGARLTAKDIRAILRWENAIGLGEVMNFPGVIAADEEILAKIASSRGRVIDGHAPGLKGKELNAYLSAGILSDHESTSLEEAREKLSKGMYLMIREGSSEKNLEALLPLVTDKTYKRCLFVVDDRNCADLLRDGDIDAVVRKAIRLGLDPVRAIQLATINSAEYFRLHGLGAIAPGYAANLVVVGDLSTFEAEMVFYRGELVAREGEALFSPFSPSMLEDKEMTHTINIKPFDIGALQIPAEEWAHPIIEIVPDQITTKKVEERPKVEKGFVLPDIERDILKLVVVERHKATGNIGLGLVKGFGLKRGALASSIAHDSHNIIAVGTSDSDIHLAIGEVEKLQGGLVIAAGGAVQGSLPLPIAGLLSPEPLAVVVESFEKLQTIARELGTRLSDPFATLSFLALPVIPELRLTDLGLVDVIKFKLIQGKDKG